MNATIRSNAASAPIAVAVSLILLSACASAPSAPTGAAEVRARLAQLQADPDLASRATPAIDDAETAVAAAEVPEPDKRLAAHRVFMADRKVATARAGAEMKLAEDQRRDLIGQRERSRLEARTREADLANAAADAARADSARQRSAADDARDELSAALNARPTDRGLVLTLGDVLFASGMADLKPAASGNLDKLVEFLNAYPSRTVVVEGYTDSVGSEDANQGLSQRRAESVRAYLLGQGVRPVRVTAFGKGEGSPVADNDSASGRQQNRRVDVIISDAPPAAR